jgi:hypothetical protein
MTYEEAGFGKLLYKTSPEASTSGELTEDVASQNITEISGTTLAGGKTLSSSGKIIIDWELGQILISDGANNRVLIGEDGL